MANEIEQPIYDVCNHDIRYHGINSKKLAENLQNSYNTSNLIYEGQNEFTISRPDILLISEDCIYGIEHFEFDDFKRRKGSTGKAFIKKKEKDFQTNFNDYGTNLPYYCESYDMENEENLQTGYEFFVDNFLYAFNEHYNKINEYKENIKNFLKEKGLSKEIKIYFLIENASPMMPFCNDDGLIYIPFYSKEIQERIQKSNDLDGIISLNKDNAVLTFIYSKEDGKINEIFPIKDKEYYHSASKPHMILSQIIIETNNQTQNEV